MQSNKELLILFILATIACLVWVATDIYRTNSSVKITPQLQKALEPVNPSFDTQTLELIQNLNAPPKSEASSSLSNP